MPGSVPHVHHVVALATVPVRTAETPDTLALECQFQGLRNSLWLSLFFSQELRLPDFQKSLTRILRDVDDLRREMGLV